MNRIFLKLSIIRSAVLMAVMLVPFIVIGQSYKLYSSDSELSSTLITRLYQDRHNMLWIATENGLNRFDGGKFTKYYHVPGDSTSLCNNYVYAICEDNNGNLLVGTHKGVQIYDYASDSFGGVSKFDDGRPFEMNIRTLLPLRTGEILASGDVLCSLKIKDGTPVATRLDILPGAATDKLLMDAHDNVWISSEQNGLYRKSPDGTIKRYFHTEASSVIDMIVASDNNLYVAIIDKGLFKYDYASDSFVSVLDDGRLPINNLSIGKNHGIYICTDGKGLKSYNCLTGQNSDIIYNTQSFDFSVAKIHSVLNDNAGNLWLAIYQRGLMMVPKQSGHFRYIGRKSINKDIIGISCITSFCRMPSGDMLIGTDNDGIYSITADYRKGIHFSPSGKEASVPAIIMKLYADSKSNIWIGAYNDGLSRFNPVTGHCDYIRGLVDNDGNNVIGVIDIIEDRRGRLWIATAGGGVYYYELESGKLHKFSSPTGPAINDWTNTLSLSEDGELYVGTYNGIYSIDTSDPSLHTGLHLPKYLAYDVLCDTGGIVWIGTSEGLLVWNTDDGKVTRFTTGDGLPSNSIYAIELDDNGYLWLSTSNGLSKLNPKTNIFTNYSVEDGLQGREFTKNASYKDANGMLWFGGINGVTYFNPQIIKEDSHKWNIRLTGFYIQGDNLINAGTKSGGKNIIKEPVFEADDFYLSHEDNSFCMELAPVEYDAPHLLAYQYSIKGEDWVTLPQGVNRILFNNFSSGEYAIRIRAVDGNNYSDEQVYNIHVASPWWKSVWAYFIYFVLLFIVVYIIWRQKKLIRVKQQEIKNRKISEEINDAKLQFMINITHELRTPMSLIVGPLTTIMANDNDSGRQRVYHTMHRNAERILTLVNQLMDLRRLDKGKLSLRFAPVDIISYIDNIIMLFEGQNTHRNISLQFKHKMHDSLEVWASPMYFDKIIINLLSNAYKYTPTGGSITIELRTYYNSTLAAPLDNYVEIIFDDNGIGIDPNDLEKIFNRFYQGKNSHNNSKPGTGIGLDLTRSLVNLHSGSIHAENNPDGGARFIVRLPLGNHHISKDEICDDVVTQPSVTPDNESSKAVLPALPKPQSRSKNRILVVEDDSEIRQYIVDSLSPYYHMLEADNGKLGLQMAFKHMPNLIISDVMMPEMDGMTMCQSIKQNINLNHIPVILLTAKVEEADNIEGLEVGADAYIAKPFTIKFLKQNVDSLLAKYERLKNIFGDKQIQEDKLEDMSVKSHDEKLMERIMSVINSNLDNPNLTADFIADKIGLSRTHLYRKLKELTNQSTRDFIRNVRLTQAANLMKQKRYSVNEIAFLVGFTDANNFSTAFKKLYGMSPSEYMSKHLSRT